MGPTPFVDEERQYAEEQSAADEGGFKEKEFSGGKLARGEKAKDEAEERTQDAE